MNSRHEIGTPIKPFRKKNTFPKIYKPRPDFNLHYKTLLQISLVSKIVSLSKSLPG